MDGLTVESFAADEVVGLSRIQQNWDDIPILDDVPNHNIVEGSLYRFRGMIQDMPNPVFYFSQYAVQNVTSGVVTVRSGKYRSSLVCAEGENLLLDDESSISSERRPYYCIGVPGLNSWAKLKSKTFPQMGIMKTSSSTTKRSVDSMDVDVAVEHDVNKRLCTEHSKSSLDSGNSTTNSPCATSDLSGACVVHVYNADDNLKVNDVVDVVGFVYAFGADQDDVDVPPSLAPRLHAVAVKTNPVMTTVTDFSPASVRSDLHLAFTQLCLGDDLAADYLICHLLSNVYSRSDEVLGKFSLNLANVPLDPAYTTGLYDVLTSLLPKTRYFPMTLENMNSSNLVPIKNYDVNRLETGLLQLADRTHLIVDETQLKTGKLLERGVKNVQVINTLLSDQSVNYDFKFYNVPFSMNVPVLVLSEGKSMLQCDTVVKLAVDRSFVVAETIEAVKSYLKEPLLSAARHYLATVATKEFNFPTDLSETVQNDLVAMRRDNAKMTPNEMHSHVVFARLLALSCGLDRLTKEIWDRASQLERLRRARL